MESPPPKISLLSLLLFSLFSLSSAASLCNPSDKRVLQQLKNRLNNPPDIAFTGWTGDCCTWFGNIGCDSNGRVTSFNIFLTSSPTAQQIPPAIGNLPFLQSIEFHGNLTGPIPDSISNLANLQSLHLSSGLTGSIPGSLSKLKKLTSLDLSGNEFSGSIPPSLGQLNSLTYLDLSLSKLSGSIPPTLARLAKLGWLDLSSNALTGPIPASLSQLTKLGRLDLRANRLTGPIPASFGSFKNPEINLFFGQNRLSGPIPRSFGNANVSALDLSMNRFTGDASFLLGRDKTALETLYLNHNHFKFDFSKMEFPITIRNLDIQHNEIYGSLPKQVGQLRWDFFMVNNNRLCGKIPTGRRLKHISPDNFTHNKCLCGVPLPPCKI